MSTIAQVRKKLVGEDRRNLVLMNVLHGHIRRIRTFSSLLHHMDLVQAKPGVDKLKALAGARLDEQRPSASQLPAEIQLVLEARQRYWAIDDEIIELEKMLERWVDKTDCYDNDQREDVKQQAVIRSQILSAKKRQIDDLVKLSKMVADCRKVVQDSLTLANGLLSDAKNMALKNRAHADYMKERKAKKAKDVGPMDDELRALLEQAEKEVSESPPLTVLDVESSESEDQVAG